MHKGLTPVLVDGFLNMAGLGFVTGEGAHPTVHVGPETKRPIHAGCKLEQNLATVSLS